MRRPQRPIADAYGLVRAADGPRLGTTRTQLQRQAASGHIERPFRGLYRVGGGDAEHADLRAALAHLGDEAVAVLGSAAQVHRLQGLPRTWLPQLTLPPGLERRQRRGMELRVWDLPPDHRTVLDEIPTTIMTRTLADVCRLLPRMRAVCLVDSALDQRRIGIDDLPDIRDLMAGMRGCRTGRASLDLARLGSQSPGETRVRLILTDAGLPPDALQVPVHDDNGTVTGYGDMGYELRNGRWIIIEFDGRSVHDRPEALLADRHRQNAMQSRARAILLRFAWEDTHTADRIPGVVGPILRDAGWSPRR
jgi:hypothetical protein